MIASIQALCRQYRPALLRDRHGQNLAEYALLLSVTAGVIFAAVATPDFGLRDVITAVWTGIVNTVNGSM